MLVLVLEHHPNGPLTDLLRVHPLSCHGSNLSRVGASGMYGAVQPSGKVGPVWVVSGMCPEHLSAMCPERSVRHVSGHHTAGVIWFVCIPFARPAEALFEAMPTWIVHEN